MGPWPRRLPARHSETNSSAQSDFCLRLPPNGLLPFLVQKNSIETWKILSRSSSGVGKTYPPSYAPRFSGTLYPPSRRSPGSVKLNCIGKRYLLFLAFVFGIRYSPPTRLTYPWIILHFAPFTTTRSVVTSHTLYFTARHYPANVVSPFSSPKYYNVPTDFQSILSSRSASSCYCIPFHSNRFCLRCSVFSNEFYNF